MSFRISAAERAEKREDRKKERDRETERQRQRERQRDRDREKENERVCEKAKKDEQSNSEPANDCVCGVFARVCLTDVVAAIDFDLVDLDVAVDVEKPAELTEVRFRCDGSVNPV